jgi:hypothetical protein
MWPKHIPWPDVTFYAPAKQVQRSAVTDTPQEGRYNELTVGWLPRRSQPPYDVPGGLDHLNKNEWFAYPAVTKDGSVSYQSQIDPFSGAFGGRLRRIDRRFSPATTFFDVLTNADSQIFEIRALTYHTPGQAPEPMVLFADKTKAPEGYQRVSTNACIDCHKDAGSVAYASGNVVGSNFNFSFPH